MALTKTMSVLVVLSPHVILTTLGALALICLAQNSPQDFIDAHNLARAADGVGNIVWDDQVAAYALNYAILRSGDCALQHSTGGPYGENLAWRSDDSLTASGAVQMWVDEIVDYDYNTNTCAPGKVCGHYTQVVWRNSLSLGCARVVCSTGGTFITCNYNPPGNFVGQKPF